MRSMETRATPTSGRTGSSPGPAAVHRHGVRDILYMGAELMPRGSGGLALIGTIGLRLLAVAGFLPSQRPAAGSGAVGSEVPDPLAVGQAR